MDTTDSKLRVRIKKTAIKVLAAFFVIYALADVSVLQAYCGNESLGIPPADHLTKSKSKVDDASAAAHHCSADRAEINHVSVSSSPSPEAPCEGDPECFGSCAHIAIPFAFIEFRETPILPKDAKIDSYQNRYNPSDLTPLFQPPKQS